MAERKDLYVNMLQQYVACSAANTLTFAEIDIGLNIFDKIGLLVNRIEYYPSSTTTQELVAATDILDMCLVQSNQIATIRIDERAVIDHVQIVPVLVGAIVSFVQVELPYARDYANMPGGGLLIAPRPLYVAIDSTGFTGAANMFVRVYFTIKKLGDSDYFELLESRRFFG